jgi:hypothetical protein
LDTQKDALKGKRNAWSHVPGLQDSDSPNHARKSKNDFQNSTGLFLLMPTMAPDHEWFLPYES